MTRIKYGLFSLALTLGLALFLSMDKPSSSGTSNHDIVDTTATADTIIIDTVQYALHHLGTGNYSIVLHQVQNDRNFLLSLHKAAKTDSAREANFARAGKLIESTLVNKVFHYWYGTPWDFDGYTNTPNKGVIACGYFVSTTLKHIGFNVNRYTLAQQNPRNEALSIACSDSLVQLNPTSSGELLDTLSQLDSGLYFVGLDNHVGYLLIRKNTPFFIHSNYIGDGGVCIELASQSEAFLGNSTYYVAPISSNKIFIEKWLKRDEVSVVTTTD